MNITVKINGQAISVDVTIEVYECIQGFDRKAENLMHQKRRHWDMRELDEYIIANECSRVHTLTPEQILCRQETLNQILTALRACTEIQQKRFLLYALEDMSYEEQYNSYYEWNFYVFFNIAFYTGLRKGEIHGLRWEDIDGEYLSVQRSISQKLKTGVDVETPPKNIPSIRTIQMPLPLIKILKEHKKSSI